MNDEIRDLIAARADQLLITDEVVGLEHAGPIVSARIQGIGGGTVSIAYALSAIRSHYRPAEPFWVRRLRTILERD